MTSTQYPLFRLFGFEVKVDISWFLIALLITWTLAAELFPQRYPGLAHEMYWWMGVTGAAGIFCSIVFHEFSHSLVARHFGIPIRGITLFIFGGIAEMEKEPTTPKAEFLIAIAGPLASFLLAFFFYRIQDIAISNEWPVFIVGVSYYLGYLNMILAIFNLVPAFPLDGGRMLRAALWASKKNLLTATRISSQIGSGFGLVLMTLGIIAFIQGQFIAGMWWLLIGVFVKTAAIATYKQLVVQNTLQNQTVRHFMSSTPITVRPTLSIEQLVENYIYKHHLKMLPVVDGSRLLGCITTREVHKVPRKQWQQRTVAELTILCSTDNTIDPDCSAIDALSKMTQPGANSRRMVVEGQHLLGMISLTDFNEFISLKLELEPTKR
ncbi:MAG: site-2 protease family protein [Gammaproteobacteria bacterium]|nr:site-2 protease family protein [Gammaproteobacteria bacterium]PCH63611.1 MAG: site-2 protease family protein [Gammaproteobacteria bacterium]